MARPGRCIGADHRGERPAPAAIERAARLGDGWLAAPALTLEQAAGQIDSYRAACDGLGRPVGAAVIRQDVHVGASSSDARAATDEIIARGYRGFDPAALAVGSVAEVTDRFGRLAAMGFGEVSVRHLVDDQAQVLASLERLGEVRARSLPRPPDLAPRSTGRKPVAGTKPAFEGAAAEWYRPRYADTGLALDRVLGVLGGRTRDWRQSPPGRSQRCGSCNTRCGVRQSGVGARCRMVRAAGIESASGSCH